MKFSNNYIFYQNNQSLEKAITHYSDIAPEDTPKENLPTSTSSPLFGYSHLQGHFEHPNYSANVLESAKNTFEQALAKLPNEPASLPNKIALLENLGSVVGALGLLQNDTALLSLSAETFNKALEERNQADAPEEWASTQNNLANILQALAQQENSTKGFKASEEANLSALTVWTRSDTPEQWSTTMHSLGITFHLHGKLLKGNRTFQKSDVAYKNALSKRDEEHMRVDRAMSHNNRGAVLQHIAEREENAERMEEALRAYEYSLTFWNEQLLPKPIATMIMANRGTARTTLAELSNDKKVAEQAIEELVLVIEVFSDACDTECVEHCREQLKKAERLVETLDNSTD